MTRKRAKKIAMAFGVSRNDAEKFLNTRNRENLLALTWLILMRDLESVAEKVCDMVLKGDGHGQ